MPTELLVKNLGRNTIRKLIEKLEGNEIISTDDCDIFYSYYDCWKSTTERRIYDGGINTLSIIGVVIWYPLAHVLILWVVNTTICYHILEQFDKTVCLFKLMVNAVVHGAGVKRIQHRRPF